MTNRAETQPRRRQSAPGKKLLRQRAPDRRRQLLEVAAESFARKGYDGTNWADIATGIGLVPTALYYHFDSKLHCLFEIHANRLAAFQAVFDAITERGGSFQQTLPALIHAHFALTDVEVAQCRVLVSERHRLAQPRSSECEEAARQRARGLVREREAAWETLLGRGIAVGAVPATDPQLLARATLGLYNSVWHWYRPGGRLALAQVEAYFTPLLLTMVGLRSDRNESGPLADRAAHLPLVW